MGFNFKDLESEVLLFNELLHVCQILVTRAAWHMIKLVLEKAEEPEIKLRKSSGS